MKGQCKGSLQSWAWKKSEKLLFKYLCLGKIRTLNGRPAVCVLQTMPLDIKSFHVLLMLFLPLVLHNSAVFPTCKCDA